MTTKEKYTAKLERLNKRYDELHEQMIHAYDNKDNETGHTLNDKLENLLDVIMLTENILNNL